MSLVRSFERMLLAMLSPGGRRARLLLLAYHRVPQTADTILPEEPDASLFAQEMDIVAAYCRVLPLPEAVRRLHDGTLPARAACITFDDGYENNLSVAMPILEARDMTGTVFVTGDAIDSGIMWNDMLIEAMRSAGSISGYQRFGMDAAQDATVPEPERIMRVVRHVRYQPLQKRLETARSFHREATGREPPRLMLTRQQVRALADRGHDVGAHTMHHPILAGLPDPEANSEIGGSFAWVREVTGRAPRSFAYPNGVPQRDYTAVHAAMVRDAGFALAVSMRHGVASRASDPFQLPRYLPWSVRTRGFAARLARTLAISRS
jgi:peptidoglycan/xylan/chitin deacetylase (PgdA/CDA1 family)